MEMLSLHVHCDILCTVYVESDNKKLALECESMHRNKNVTAYSLSSIYHNIMSITFPIKYHDD